MSQFPNVQPPYEEYRGYEIELDPEVKVVGTSEHFAVVQIRPGLGRGWDHAVGHGTNPYEAIADAQRCARRYIDGLKAVEDGIVNADGEGGV